MVIQVIRKKALLTAEEQEDVRREVAVMHHLKGHPNVVSLKDVFEDTTHVCIVMELCSGEDMGGC
jgi:calcium-dependent protein kinase